MKKLLLMAIIAGFTYFGAAAQDVPGNSNYGHSHKKAKPKKAKKHYSVTNSTAAQRKAANVQHRTTIKTVKDNDVLTNQQQKDQVKQANATHKQQMRTISTAKTSGKKK